MKRNHGKITFVDLRDFTGKIQCVGQDKMSELTTESVVEVMGIVRKRPQNLINPNIDTGTIEVEVGSYKLLNKCGELPIPVDSTGYEIKEELRFKYRYLDLRRERMQKIIRLRSKFIEGIRKSLFKKDFVEVETPILTKSTREGARDFIVPSRHFPGKFYALPQSPQQYKQLLMTAGFERYFQIAKCVRDEDTRSDRGYEFTQLDLEMSFVSEEDVMHVVEEAVVSAVESLSAKIKSKKFQVFSYKEALEKYGSEKFDLRTDKEKEDGVLAFVWVNRFPFFKKVDVKDAAEVEDSKSGYTFTHNPFSRPIDEHLPWHLKGEHIEEILTTQYDLVCNGYEVGGGSLRAYTEDVLRSTYKIMGYSEGEILGSVGHMFEAFKLGTPPHGGIALGLDRLVMLASNEESLKETIAFPMTGNGKTSVMDAPSAVDPKLLSELGLSISS